MVPSMARPRVVTRDTLARLDAAYRARWGVVGFGRDGRKPPCPAPGTPQRREWQRLHSMLGRLDRKEAGPVRPVQAPGLRGHHVLRRPPGERCRPRGRPRRQLPAAGEAARGSGRAVPGVLAARRALGRPRPPPRGRGAQGHPPPGVQPSRRRRREGRRGGHARRPALPRWPDHFRAPPLTPWNGASYRYYLQRYRHYKMHYRKLSGSVPSACRRLDELGQPAPPRKSLLPRGTGRTMWDRRTV